MFDCRGRVFGATMTSALGEVLAKRTSGGGEGTRELTIILTVKVGVICRVSGWEFGVV